jgi:hypothetical protein
VASIAAVGGEVKSKLALESLPRVDKRARVHRVLTPDLSASLPLQHWGRVAHRSGTIARLTSIGPSAIMRCTGAAMNKKAVFAAVAICLLSVAFTQNSTDLEDHGIVVAYMDRSVKPGDDFYRYANGGWIKNAQIPLDSGYVELAGYQDDSSDLSRKRCAD